VRSGREHLQKLADEVTEEAMKQVRDRCAHRAGVPLPSCHHKRLTNDAREQTISSLLATPPPDPLLVEMDVINANMNLHVLVPTHQAS
jgi:hypothetical protein